MRLDPNKFTRLDEIFVFLQIHNEFLRNHGPQNIGGDFRRGFGGATQVYGATIDGGVDTPSFGLLK